MVCELREVEAELIVGSAWAEEGCRGWSTVSFELVGAQAVGGGVPEVLGRERVKQQGEKDAGLLQVLGHARVGVLGLCAALATAAAAELAGATWRGEEGYNAWGSGSRGCEVPREAAGEAGGGLRPPSVAGGGAQRRRR